MIYSYDVNWDDDLKYAQKAVEFLEKDFNPNDYPMWSVNYLNWKLSNSNPAGKGFFHIMLCNDKVIGTASLTRKRLILDGKEILGGEIGDTYSSSKLRKIAKPKSLSFLDSNPSSYINKSIFGRCIAEITHRAERTGVDCIYGTPNKNSYPGYTSRLNFIDLKEYMNFSMSRYSLEYFSTKLPKLIFASISILDKILFRSISLFSSRKESKNKLILEEVFPSDDQINILWETEKPHIGLSLIRDSLYWRHRYLKHPINNYKIISIRINNSLCGIIALRIIRDEYGFGTVMISEWLVKKEISFRVLLKSLIRFFDDNKIKKYNFWVQFSIKSFFYSIINGFVPTSRIPIIFFQSRNFVKIRKDIKDFKFFMGSSDNV